MVNGENNLIDSRGDVGGTLFLLDTATSKRRHQTRERISKGHMVVKFQPSSLYFAEPLGAPQEMLASRRPVFIPQIPPIQEENGTGIFIEPGVGLCLCEGNVRDAAGACDGVAREECARWHEPAHELCLAPPSTEE
ncbi:hypothetical protein AB5N19_12304 [Seiridium cardinale]